MPEEGPRRFEPPPWEREQFEALAKKRAAEEERRRAEEEGWRRAAEERKRAAEAEAPVITEAEPVKPGPRPAEIEAMIVRLEAQEKVSRQGTWVLMTLVGSGSTAFGLVMIVVALLQLGKLARAGLAGAPAMVGWLGTASIALVGMAFFAGGAWMTVKGLKRQGVL